MAETRTRTLAKAVTWQLLGLFTTTSIGWLITGSAAASAGLAASSAAVGFACYVLHERVWHFVPWGIRRR